MSHLYGPSTNGKGYSLKFLLCTKIQNSAFSNSDFSKFSSLNLYRNSVALNNSFKEK